MLPVTNPKNERTDVLGANLRRYRKAKGLTQRALAEAIGYTDLDSGRVYIARIERGDVAMPRQNLRALAEAVGVSVDALLGFKAERPDVTAILDAFSASDEARKMVPPASKRELDWLRANTEILVGPPPNPRAVAFLLLSLRERDDWAR
jgi:transcriptional regulator with XRE-family HTH domain